MAKTVFALNTVSGIVGAVPAAYLKLPILGDSLVEVPEGTKSYDPKFFKPTTAAEHQAKPTTQRKDDKNAVVEVTSDRETR
jgi:hypothetical protein